jgi:hypothetical protein
MTEEAENTGLGPSNRGESSSACERRFSYSRQALHTIGCLSKGRRPKTLPTFKPRANVNSSREIP